MTIILDLKSKNFSEVAPSLNSLIIGKGRGKGMKGCKWQAGLFLSRPVDQRHVACSVVLGTATPPRPGAAAPHPSLSVGAAPCALLSPPFPVHRATSP